MTVRFSGDGPKIPAELLDSLLAGEVVFLCGTGISAPQLPDFPRLVEETFLELSVEKTDSERTAFDAGRFEEVLGSLCRRLADPDAMTRKVSELLAVPERPKLDQHRTILRLSRDLDNRISVVTTNFYTLLERAPEEVLVNATAADISFAGQALPAPGSASFSGIVHIHGRLSDRERSLEPSQLVLTSADYGDAYMRSGWASRFLFDLARCKTIVLVGYSANDAPVRYFLNVLEADRARFPDLKPVYAFDAYEKEPEEVTLSWRTVAVTPLPYCKINPDTGDEDHAPLWRDLTALADVVERPKHSRQEHARAILERPAADASAESRRELRWLFAGRRDLWSVALNAIADPEWFKVFQEERLWPGNDAVWVIAAWIAKEFQNAERFECALEWQDRLGRPFTDKIGECLLQAKGLDEAWIRVWRLFCLVEPVQRHDPMHYATQKCLASGVVLDSDLRRATSLLAPTLVLSRSHREPEATEEGTSIQGLGDLASTRMVISDRHTAEEVIDALQGMADCSGRILELATSELRSALELEAETGLIAEEHDHNDLAVPSIETHAQNQYRDGVNYLVRLLVECLPQAALLDRNLTRGVVAGWRTFPGRIGLRLCLHAMRNADVFQADQAMSMLLAASDVDFWSIRRELALLPKERSGGASQEVLSQVEERIRTTSGTYYDRFPIGEGEADWRAHARDAAVWLRLKMLQDAGTLAEVGVDELSAITRRRDYLDREVDQRDLFSSYSSGVRMVVGDAGPIEEAPKDDRLRVALELAHSPDLDLQQGWFAFCRSDPQGAFDSLLKGELTPENAVLWSQFLSGLAFGDDESKAIRDELSVRALDHLHQRDAGRLQPMIAGLCDLIAFSPRQRVQDVDGWLMRLWEMIWLQPDEWVGPTGDI